MSRRCLTVLLVATLAAMAGCRRESAPAAASGAPDADGALPPVAAARPLQIPVPVERTLANGLRVIVLPRPGRSLVAAEFLVLSGGEVDPANRAGLADFTASLLIRGSRAPTGARSAPQLAAAAEALGGSLSAQAGWDASRIGITVTTPKLAAALDLLAEVVRYPAFAQREVERLRAQTLDSLRLSLGDPVEIADQVAARRVHGESRYGHPRLGTVRSVAAFTVAELRQLHRRHYRPDHAVLVLAGDLDPETGVALAAQIFGDWLPDRTAAPAQAQAATVIGAVAGGTPADVLIVDLPDAGQAAVVTAAALPPRADIEHYEGLVTAVVLGGGYSSRLNREIRIKRGLSYDASADFRVQRGAGALYASAQTKNESAAEVAALLRAEITRLSTELVPDDELAARKASYDGSFVRGLLTAEGLASLIAAQIARGMPASEIAQVTARVDAVSADAIRDYASRHLSATALRTVIVGDARQFADAVRQQGLSVKVIPVDQLDLDRPDLGAQPRR